MLQWFPGRGQRHTPSSSTVQQTDSRNQTSRQTRQPSGSLPAQSSRVHNARSQGAGAEDGLIFSLFFFILNKLCFFIILWVLSLPTLLILLFTILFPHS